MATLMAGQLVCITGWHSFCVVPGLRPPRVKRAAAWDLPPVQQTLSKSPFDPMAGVTLRNTLMKTAFLLAVMTAKHVSELHGLSMSPTCLR